MKRISWSLSAGVIGCSLLRTSLLSRNASAKDFLVRVENVSTPHTLYTSLGDKGAAILPALAQIGKGGTTMVDGPRFLPKSDFTIKSALRVDLAAGIYAQGSSVERP